jgi:DNA-binding CsgD family transcriptional regulator
VNDHTKTFSHVLSAAGRHPARLRVVGGEAAERSFELRDEVVVVGRDPSADVCLEAEGVSRHHAKIVTDLHGSAQIVDLGAKNGTFVNGERTKAATLEHGDQIQIGRVVLRFERASPGASTIDAQPSDATFELSPRELDVARLVARGLTNAEIGKVLGISRATVATHLQRAYERLGFGSRAELASWVSSREDC